jgi:hypothetical protein
MSTLVSHCPHCIKPIEVPLPVEPLYSFDSLCLLVPVKPSTLTRWLTLNKSRLDAPLYTGPRKRPRRLFTANDVRVLREHFIRSVRWPAKTKPADGR